MHARDDDPRRPAEAGADPSPGAERTREVEQALLRVAHSLAGAGYGVLMWEPPRGTRRKVDESPTG